MKTKYQIVLGIPLSLGLLMSTSTQGAIDYDENVTPNAIFGSGNANGFFAVDQGGGVELGLRAKVRYPTPANTFNSDGAGTYTHAAGTPGGGLAMWNFEFSVNSDYLNGTRPLNALTYLLRIDSDPSANTSFLSFDPINQPYADHSIGNNTTGNGAGVEAANAAAYGVLIANNNVAQNSWNMGMGFLAPFLVPPFNPNAPGTYTFVLSAFDGANQVASTTIDVNVVVPEASTYLAGALLLLPFGMSTLRKMLKNRKA
jgi:hypothetical protein